MCLVGSPFCMSGCDGLAQTGSCLTGETETPKGSLSHEAKINRHHTDFVRNGLETCCLKRYYTFGNFWKCGLVHNSAELEKTKLVEGRGGILSRTNGHKILWTFLITSALRAAGSVTLHPRTISAMKQILYIYPWPQWIELTKQRNRSDLF